MSKLLIDEYPLLVLPSLAVKIGLNEAIVLQQVHYWVKQSGKPRDGRMWIYNTFEDWRRQFPFFSMSTLKRTIKSLETSGFLLTGSYNKQKTDRTKWYTIDLDMLNSPLCQNNTMGDSALVQSDTMRLGHFETMDNVKVACSVPETNTEINTDTTTSKVTPVVVPVVAPILNITGEATNIILPKGITQQLLADLAIKYVPAHGADIVDRQLINLKDAQARGIIERPGAWLTNACKKNYPSAANINLFAVQENKELEEKLVEKLNTDSSSPHELADQDFKTMLGKRSQWFLDMIAGMG